MKVSTLLFGTSTDRTALIKTTAGICMVVTILSSLVRSVATNIGMVGHDPVWIGVLAGAIFAGVLYYLVTEHDALPVTLYGLGAALVALGAYISEVEKPDQYGLTVQFMIPFFLGGWIMYRLEAR
jgi:hypothetical protein